MLTYYFIDSPVKSQVNKDAEERIKEITMQKVKGNLEGVK